jgi:hypothetical protein
MFKLFLNQIQVKIFFQSKQYVEQNRTMTA